MAAIHQHHPATNSSCAALIASHLPKNVTKVFECAERSGGFVLRIGGIESAPMMRRGPNGKLTGLVVDVIRYLTRVGRMSYILFECDDPQFGFRKNDGQWTGCLGMIQRKEADLFLMPAATSPSRMTVSSPTAPLLNADLIIMSGEPEKVSVASLEGLNHFDLNVWLLFSAAFATVVGVSVISERLWRRRTRKRVGFWSGSTSPVVGVDKSAESYNFGRTFFAFLGTLAFQSLSYTNPDDSWRILLATWSFSALVVVTLFSGQLTASMTVSNRYVLMDNLVDVLNYKSIKPIIMAKTSFEYFFRDADPGSEPRLIFEQASRLGGLVPLASHANPEHISEMLARRAVIIGPPFALKAKIGKYCDSNASVSVHFSQSHYYERMMTMSFRLGIPEAIVERINYGLHRYTDAGHVLKFVRSMELNALRCVWSEPISDRERVLALNNVSGPFVLWCFGVSISAAILLLEMITGEAKRRSKLQRRYSVVDLFYGPRSRHAPVISLAPPSKERKRRARKNIVSAIPKRANRGAESSSRLVANHVELPLS